jgi:hypothetical protein
MDRTQLADHRQVIIRGIDTSTEVSTGIPVDNSSFHKESEFAPPPRFRLTEMAE